MGASASLPGDEEREYFWQTFFWLECGKTGIGIAKLRVFQEDEEEERKEAVRAALAAAPPLPVEKDVFANDGNDAIDAIDNDIEMGKDTQPEPLAALLPEAKKDLLPPIDTKPPPLALPQQPEEEEYEEVEVDDDEDEIKLVRQVSGDISPKKKKIIRRRKVSTSSMSTSMDDSKSHTEIGTDPGKGIGMGMGTEMSVGGDEPFDASYQPSAKLFPLLVVRKMKAAAGIGDRTDANRPLLAELRALNRPGPDEEDGVTQLKSAADEYDPSDPKRLLRSEKSLARQLEARSVLVAVRMRPFNKRERGLNDKLCIDIPTATKMIVKGVGDKREDRPFNFDCAFGWDATQVQVYKRTGRPLLIKALNGYNACLFAYGQTGSGKTYTMLGVEDDKGVIPLMLEELFENVKAQREHGRIITVTMSMLEIYNEHLHDLLIRTGTGNDKDLTVREDKIGGRGVFVDGLTEFQVDSAKHALKYLNDAQGRRAVGRTNMNEHSSRSHAVITLHISVVGTPGSEGIIATNSKLHLIDLAGSERQSKTGASGDQLKEGAAINLSLTALGNVINALTESTKGKDQTEMKSRKTKGKAVPKKPHIPYRDSKLTRILQDSLGGNSVTCMLTAMSPADSNKEETVSALRFAERAKKIENKVKKNVNAKELALANAHKLTKALEAKVARLQKHIDRLEHYY